MNYNLTQDFTGTRWGQYCWKRSQNMEHEVSQKSIGFDLFMMEAARQDSTTARISKIPWLCFEQFKDTLVEYQLTLSWWVTFGFLTIGKSFFFTGGVLSAFNPSLRTDWFRVERKATKDGKLSSSHHLTLLVEIPTKKNPVRKTQFLKKRTTTVIRNVTRMQIIG